MTGAASISVFGKPETVDLSWQARVTSLNEVLTEACKTSLKVLKD